MTDISKCVGTNCPMRKRCKRFLVESGSYHQSYIPVMFKPSTGCDYFWPEPIKPVIKKSQIFVDR